MGKGRRLNLEEIGKIKALRKEDFKVRQIAKKIGRSHQVIINFLRNKDNYGKNYKGRTKKATTEKERRLILRKASNSALTARQIKSAVGTSASLRTVQRVIKNCRHLKRLKMKRKPALKANHRSQRLQFAKDHMSWTKEWQKVIFTDEKKFNFDGPDGFSYYFHDLRKEETILSRRRKDSGSTMVWGAISSKGVIDLVILEGRQDAEKYKELLIKEKPKIRAVMKNQKYIFQQDNASIHTAKIIKEWFLSNKIDVMDWPSLSPDLNIIENVWGYLSRQVYANGKQYNTKEELKNSILDCWKKIPQDYIQKLYSSIPARIFEVIQKNGGSTHY